MKKGLVLVSCAAAMSAMLMTGCMSSHKNVASAMISPEIKPKYEPQIKMLGKKMVKAHSKMYSVLGFSWGESKFADNLAVPMNCWCPLVNKAKKAAGYKAAQKTKADVLLAPMYDIVEENYFFYRTVTCKLKAFPGRVTGIKEK